MKPPAEAPAREPAAPSPAPAPALRSGGLTGHATKVQGPAPAGAKSLTALRAKAPPSAEAPPLFAAHKLRLKSPAGTVEIPASSYYLTNDGRPRPELGALGTLALSRDPRAQAKINEALTDGHGAHEMSFRVKDPETGNYDKIFKVPVHGTPVPMREAHFRTFVDSTAPVMRALRGMLQVIYSNPNPSPKDLGIDELPKADQERILRTISESLYFEPKLRTPAMKDYPFLAVAGFDAAVGNLEDPAPIFFEYNLGTPSGLSNNLQLVDLVREHDPELFQTFADRLPDDPTFAILKRSIESNALAWTGRPEGITVAISPGVYNGAHPDVASIATMAGMPLVNPSDLYQDRNGDVRLNTGKPGEHPLVTGIYGRMEESFFLQDSRDGIPLRSPDHLDNPELGKKFGLELEPGIIYAYDYSDRGEIVGVQTDANGKPKLQEVFESIGRDPARPDEPPGSFLRAITGKKLYYSGIGGRVVDDKRVFQAISEHVAPRFAEPGAPIARPPRTLDPSEYHRFYDAEDLTKFVVKEPDKSGGSGVSLLVNLAPEARLAVVEEVKKDPGRYIVQEFAELAVMLSAEKSESGAHGYGSLAADWRIFTMMDADGKVDAGPSSLLLRTAKPFSASTNTSQGGSYGIGLVLADAPGEARTRVLPEPTPIPVMGASRRADLVEFLKHLNTLTEASAPGAQRPIARDGSATLLAQYQRQVMDLLGRDLAKLMTVARSFDEGKIDAPAFHAELKLARAEMLTTRFQVEGVSDEVLRVLPAAALERRSGGELRKKPAVEGLVKRLTIDAGPPELVREEELGGRLVRKLETGAVKKSGDPFIDQTIRELTRAGGELRRIELVGQDGAKVDETPAGYFRVTPEGRPIIGLDLTQDFALSGLAHEREHFKLWQQEKGALERQGVPKAEAAAKALENLNTPAQRVIVERAAVTAEMAMEERDSPFNRGARRPSTVTEPGYIARLTYPEVEGLRELLHGARWSGRPLDEGAAMTVLEAAIGTAASLRKERFEARMKAADKAAGGERADLVNLAHAELSEPLFEAIFDRGALDRLRTDGTLGEAQRLFAKALARLDLDEAVVVPVDRQRFLAEAERMQQAQ